MREPYQAGERINLRTQSIKCVDGQYHTSLYTHWDGQLQCEGNRTVTLTQHKADSLNTYGKFIR
jgi:hypothetical protein